MRTLRIAAAALCACAVVVVGVHFVGPRLGPGASSHVSNHPAGLAMPAGERGDRDRMEEGNAYDAFEWWYGTRAFPNELIPPAAYYRAHLYARQNLAPPAGQGLNAGPQWSSIGPTNIGGRMLAVAVDPSNPNVLWAGASSGGLWKSTTAGEGASAWTLIDTGFPTVSVSSIALDPTNPQVMYIGTGEIGRYARGQVGTPGARSTYGLGVLKSTDGGVSWAATGLNWTFDQTRAVQAVKIDPTNTAILWAATTEGLYKSTDAGATWTNSHPSLMAMDVAVDPSNHQRVYVSHGQLNGTPDPGIYRTTDGGATWTQLTNGLPASNFGRTPLAIYAPSPLSPHVLYAGVSDANSRSIVGLYKSTNNGDSWTRVNSTNYAGSQAWYDNVVAVHPQNPNTVICGGLDWYRSTNGGGNLGELSYWYLGYGGVIPPGGPEGPSNYVHADQHAAVFDPTNPTTIYIGCDGGIFKSTDGGTTWAGKNGGLVTTQIYNGFANGYTTDALALGGLQDNGTIEYLGTPAWSKVFGGDGGWCAIDNTNENVFYEEYVYCDIYKSNDGGNNWNEIHVGDSGNANFIAPFVLSEANHNILYAGMRSVQKSTNGGSSWFYPDGNANWNGTPMACIGVSFTSPDTVIAATGSSTTGAVFEVRRSTNGGTSWTVVSAGMPNRFPTDIAFARQDSRQVWLSFSGYGTPHVFASTDAGLTWTDRTGNLPDIPVQSVVVDPVDTSWIYAGTDLGVFRSLDGGATWTEMNAGMPPAMVLDLKIRAADRVMRAATFGNGIYEMALAQPASVETADRASGVSLSAARPNPFRETTAIRYTLDRAAAVRLAIYDQTGRMVRLLAQAERGPGAAEVAWDGRDARGVRLPAGVYFARLSAGAQARSMKVTLLD